ncbi:MAG: LamG domain-containing protein [Candidatus Aenigmatarchaeota archaeon]
MNWLDFSVSGIIFIGFIVIVLIISTNYFSNKISEIRSNEIARSSEAYLNHLTNYGVENDWDIKNQKPVNLGFGREIYFLPIYTNSTGNKRNYDVFRVDVEFDNYCERKINTSSVRLFNRTLKEINYTLVNQNFCGEYIKNASVVFYDNLKNDKYYLYYSSEPLVYANYTLNYNISIYMDFDFAHENWFFDKTENENNGFLTNGNIEAGKFQKSLRLNKNGILNISENKKLNSSMLSVDFWLKINEYGDSIIIEKAGSYGIRLGRSPEYNKVVGYIQGLPESQQPLSPSIELNEWNHIVFTSDGNQHNLYLNGLLVNTTTYNSPIPVVSSPLSVGGDYNQNNLFNGNVDELRIYSIVLSNEDVLNSNASSPSKIIKYPEIKDTMISMNKIKNSKKIDFDYFKKILGNKYNFRIEVYKN